MDVSICEIIRETRNSINSRLDMLEMLVSRHTCNNNTKPFDKYNENDQIDHLNNKFINLSEKVFDIECMFHRFENKQIEKSNNCSKCYEKEHSCICGMPPLELIHQIPELIVEEDAITKIKKALDEQILKMNKEEEYCDECGGECDGAHGASGEKAIKQMKENGLEVKDNKIVRVIPVEEEVVEEEEEVVEEETTEEEVLKEETTEEVVEEEVVEEEEETTEEEEEAVEEEGLELEEFEYKDITLYRDSENKVYRMVEEGVISDPIGIWDESRQKIKKL